MTQVARPLSMAEADALAEHEAVIAGGLQTFVEVGKALLAIRDSRLYRTSYATFEEYCQGTWSLSRRHVNRMVQASQVVELMASPDGTSEAESPAVGPIGPAASADRTESAESKPATTAPTFLAPTNEAQARPLARLLPTPDATPEERVAAEERVRETWQKAARTAPRGADGKPKITAGHVERTVTEAQEAVGGPASDSAAVRDALEEYVSADPNLQNDMYIHKFMSAFQSGGKWLAFDVERVANLIDETDLMLLGYHVESVGRFVEAVRRSRRGLRVINGGNK